MARAAPCARAALRPAHCAARRMSAAASAAMPDGCAAAAPTGCAGQSPTGERERHAGTCQSGMQVPASSGGMLGPCGVGGMRRCARARPGRPPGGRGFHAHPPSPGRPAASGPAPPPARRSAGARARARSSRGPGTGSDSAVGARRRQPAGPISQAKRGHGPAHAASGRPDQPAMLCGHSQPGGDQNGGLSAWRPLAGGARHADAAPGLLEVDLHGRRVGPVRVVGQLEAAAVHLLHHLYQHVLCHVHQVVVVRIRLRGHARAQRSPHAASGRLGAASACIAFPKLSWQAALPCQGQRQVVPSRWRGAPGGD